MKSNALKTNQSGLYPVNAEETVKRLEIASDLLNVFMKQSPNLAWVVDEHAHLIFASQAFFKYFGLKEEEATGKPLPELVPKLATPSVTRSNPLNVVEKLPLFSVPPFTQIPPDAGIVGPATPEN